MALSKKQVVILGGVVVLVLVFVLMGVGIIPGLKRPPVSITQAKLTMWGVEDSDAELRPLFQVFAAAHPGVTVQYRQFGDADTYHAALLEALAAGTGPDIYAVRNTEVMRHLPKLVAMPGELLSALSFRNNFAPVVERDFKVKGSVVALPLSVDTLALVYNRDLLNQAGIVAPPATWEELVAMAPKLVKTDAAGRITQASVALGGSAVNTPRVADILSALFLESGLTPVYDDWANIGFVNQKGYEALRFYLQFSNTASPLYTWHEGMPNALDAFAQGRVAMIFEYASALGDIRERNPLINFAVAPLPQHAGAAKATTMASYWGYTVSRQSRQGRLAWELVVSAATEGRGLATYLASVPRPPASPLFVDSYRENPDLSVFARQILIAGAWPMPHQELTTQIFSDVVTTVLENRASVETAIAQGASRLSQLINERPK